MYALALALSVLIGVALGLLGGGGSMLTTPILLYVLHLPTKEAIATSIIVVGTTSLAAVVQHARAGNVAWKTGLLFGASGGVGAYLGGRAAHWVPDRVLMLLFAGMMIATSVAMFRGRKATTDAPEAATGAGALGKILLNGLAVGTVTGLLGAGGGFLVVPALTLFGGLPMRQAVGTSLLVIALNSVSGVAGQASSVSVDLQTAGAVSVAAVAGSVVGGYFAPRVPAELLRKGFAGFVLFMGIFVFSKQL